MSDQRITDAEWSLIQQLHALNFKFGTFPQSFVQWHLDLGRDHCLSDKERAALARLAKQFRAQLSAQTNAQQTGAHT